MLDNRYQLGEEIGKGAMGEVFRGRDTNLDIDVAIKFLTPSNAPGFTPQRFEREVRAASKLSHENLATILNFGVTDDGVSYMVSTFIEGKTLAQYLKEVVTVDIDTGIDLLMQLTDCLNYIHREGVLHRDLKPSNIILQEEVGQETKSLKACLVDFGIVKLLGRQDDDSVDQDQLTAPGQVIGTPIYMSPEQGRGRQVDARSDVYQLGCVAFEMFSGNPPFVGPSAIETISMHQNDELPSIEEELVPPRLYAILEKMLEKSPRDRYRSMMDVSTALDIYRMSRQGTASDDQAVQVQVADSNARLKTMAKWAGALLFFVLLTYGILNVIR